MPGAGTPCHRTSGIPIISTNILADDEMLSQFEVKPGEDLSCLGIPFGAESNALVEAGPLARLFRIQSNSTKYPVTSTSIMVLRMAKTTLPQQHAEGLRYLMGQGELNNVLERLCADLDRGGIDYMVIGAVALMAHGYPRFTEDIDLVLTPEGLEAFHQKLVGLGYVPAFSGARKKLRTAPEGVNIEVITSGEYPGDGKPKPVQFPNPTEASVEIDGVRVVTLEKLIELKLASGMTAPDRLKDLADVQELIKASHLGSEFASRLNPYVRDQYRQLWDAVHRGRER